MLLQTIASSALALAPSVAGAPAPAFDHGDLPWFEGTFEELVAKATAEEKLIFVDFWADW